MNESVEFYQKQARMGWSKQPGLALLQRQALQSFIDLGFPTRHHEDWKYTSLESFLQHRFVMPATPSDIQACTPERPQDCHAITIANGQVMDLDAVSARLPAGVIVLPIAEALASMPERVLPYLGHVLTSEHAFHCLNTAMIQAGVFIYIPSHVRIEQPIWLTHWQDKAHQVATVRHVMVAEAGSQWQVVEDYSGADAACYFTNSVTELVLAQGASVTHSKFQRESRAAFHVGHLAVTQARDSQFESHSISLGGQWVRSDLTIQLLEPYARCLMNGLYLPGDDQHMDHHTLVHHAVHDCQSEQDYKGMLQGRARAVFNGRVVVALDAQHSHAQQHNKNLMLSAQAEIDTKPQLEIYADDVVCSHGATVGQLDEDSLFYLATRGIGRAEASRYLMRAFVEGNLRRITNASLAAWTERLVNQRLDSNHE